MELWGIQATSGSESAARRSDSDPTGSGIILTYLTASQIRKNDSGGYGDIIRAAELTPVKPALQKASPDPLSCFLCRLQRVKRPNAAFMIIGKLLVTQNPHVE